MLLSPNQRAFHAEEYKQLKGEASQVLARIELLFRLSIIVVASSSAWLATNTIGWAGSPANVCLKLPLIMVTIGWLISPTFVLGAGLLASFLALRVETLGEYLRQLETVLAHRELGWEKHLSTTKRQVESITIVLWYSLLLVSIVIAGIAIFVSASTAAACPK